MKLEHKMTLYFMLFIFLSIGGITLMIFDFDFLMESVEKDGHLALLVMIKTLGILLIYIGSTIYNKHLKIFQKL